MLEIGGQESFLFLYDGILLVFRGALKSIHFQSQKERKVTGTKVIRINAKDMENFVIVLPSLAIQSRLVSILDKFDELTMSISYGLPHEIELRQKQYEYVRDQLFKFD